jgi:hypothetical protein
MKIAIAVLGFIAAGMLINWLHGVLTSGQRRDAHDESLEAFEHEHRRSVYGAD